MIRDLRVVPLMHNVSCILCLCLESVSDLCCPRIGIEMRCNKSVITSEVKLDCICVSAVHSASPMNQQMAELFLCPTRGSEGF